MQLKSKLLFFSLVPFICFSQDIPMETWRNHFSYHKIELIQSSSNSIIASATNGLFYINKSDNSINYLSKLDGLSDVGVSAMFFNTNDNSLALGYPNGLIDIYRDGEVLTVTEVFESLLVGDKFIQDIEARNGKVFAANGFGIVVINATNGEVIENYQSIGENASDVTAFELATTSDKLVAITSQGIQTGLLNQNLLDFNNWQTIASDTSVYKGLEVISPDEVVSIVDNNTILAFDLNGNGARVLLNSDEIIHQISVFEGKPYVLILNSVYLVENQDIILIRESDQPINTFHMNDGLWLGTNDSGMIAPNGEPILPNGPISEFSHLSFTDNSTYGFYGPAVESYTDQIDSMGYSYFDGQRWNYVSIDGFYNITDGQHFNGDLYLSSAGYGLMNASSGSSIGIPLSSISGKVVIPNIESASKLYIPCFEHQTPLLTLNTDGSVTEYDSDYSITQFPTSLSLSNSETIWLTRSTFDGGGIISLDLQDDNFRVITTADELPNNNVNSVAISQIDEAWVGTNSGLVSFNDATFIFDDFNAIEAIFNSDALFNGQTITAVAIDGGNRVWVGTEEEGIWVFDSNLSRLDFRFTARNSPLPSNNIKEFSYNAENGEMFILTTKGLSSFRSNSTVGGFSHSEVNIFPNPVRPGFTGKVGIEGLVQNAILKITDINGKLIREVVSNGGTASWDLLDYNNSRAQSGVYLILSSSLDGKESFIGKIAVINND